MIQGIKQYILEDLGPDWLYHVLGYNTFDEVRPRYQHLNPANLLEFACIVDTFC